MKTGAVELEALAGRLRARVAERRYAAARIALQEYCQTLRKMVAALPPGDPSLRRLEDEWRCLLEETRRRVLTGRMHAGARLARLPRIPGLYHEACVPRHTWEYSG